MGKEKISMQSVPNHNVAQQNKNSAITETNVEGRLNRYQQLPVQPSPKTLGKITCDEHELEMQQVGTSNRGIQEYFCPRGCKAEIGTGRVKKVIRDRGFGFLITLKSREELFFHFSHLEDADSVTRGDLFKFRVGFNPHSGKLQAVRLKPLYDLRRVKK